MERSSARCSDEGKDMDKAVFSDWDKTLTRVYSSHEFMQHCADRKLIDRKYAELIRHTTLRMKAGKISYLKSLAWFKKAIAGFVGVDYAQARMEADAFAAEFYEEGSLYGFVPSLVREARDRGYEVVVVTGSLGFLARALGERAGIKEVIGTQEIVEAGRIAGFDETVLSVDGKAKAVKAWAQLHNMELRRCIGIGDTLHDAGFMGACGKAIAFDPDVELRKVAERRKWAIAGEESILTALNAYL